LHVAQRSERRQLGRGNRDASTDALCAATSHGEQGAIYRADVLVLKTCYIRVVLSEALCGAGLIVLSPAWRGAERAGAGRGRASRPRKRLPGSGNLLSNTSLLEVVEHLKRSALSESVNKFEKELGYPSRY